MAKRKEASWRKRRWTIFLRAYQANTEFRKELEDYHKSHKGNLYDQDSLELILFKYGVSYLCCGAVVRFMDNPALDEGIYLKRILPPIFIGSELSSSVEPLNAEYTKLSANELIRNPEAKLPEGVHYNTELSIQPYVTKSELHELIDEYWPEIEPRINQRTKHGDKIFGTKLLGKVQPSKTKTHAERDELIAQLYNEKRNDKYIGVELRDKGYGDLEENNIKQIRFKLGLTKKRKS